jgi:hypothetical protein
MKRIIPILVFLPMGILVGILAFRIWDPPWNPFSENPKKVIEKMTAEMERVKTSEGKVDFSFNKRDGGEFNLNFNIQGKEDLREEGNQKSQTIFKVNFFQKENQSNFDFEYAGEKRVIGKTIYLKFTQLPEIYFLNLSPLKDRWIKIDQDSLGESLKRIFGEKITPEEEKIYREKFLGSDLQKELQEKLGKVLTKKEIFLVKKRLPDQKVGQKVVYRFLVNLNSQEVLKGISEIPKETEGQISESEGFLEGFKKFFEKFGDLEGEIWIGKKDYLLYKIKVEKDFDLGKLGEKGEVKLKLNVENLNYNLPIEIEVPSEYQTLEEIFSSFSERYSEKLKVLEDEIKDVKIIVGLVQAKRMAELMKNSENSFEDLCKNGTLNEEKEIYNLKEIEEEIKNLQGGNLRLSCYSSKESFCLSVDLISLNRKRYCIDSLGNVKEIDQNLNCLGKGTKEDPYSCP